MAPREATGTFPDQFLTFDYDISANMVVQPPQHDPFPIVTAGQTQIDIENNLIAGGGAQDNNDNNMFNGLQQTAGINPNTSHGGVGPPNTTNAQHQQQHPSSQEVVDPLSIDPTVNQASRPLLWEADNLNMSTSNASTMLRVPHMPPMDHPASLSRGISGTSTVTVRTVNPVYQRHATTEQAVSVSQQQQQHHQHHQQQPRKSADGRNYSLPQKFVSCLLLFVFFIVGSITNYKNLHFIKSRYYNDDSINSILQDSAAAAAATFSTTTIASGQQQRKQQYQFRK